jgi:hypothetical protein
LGLHSSRRILIEITPDHQTEVAKEAEIFDMEPMLEGAWEARR